MSFVLFTDSSSNVDNDIIEQYGLRIFPLTFMDENGNESYSYQDGRKVDLTEFYNQMRNGTVFKTSLPHLDLVERMIRSDLDMGQDILYLGFSSGLSGTFQAISSIMDSFKDEYPQRTLVAVDTLAAAGGQGLLVVKAAQLAQEGMSLQDVANWVEDNKLNSGHWFTVDDLVYLFRGGRVSKSSAWAGNLLNIKPVLHVDDNGALIPQEKIRGRKKSLQALVNHMAASMDQDLANQVVFINHGDCLEDALYVEGLIKKQIGDVCVHVDMLDPVIGAHTGPGLVALFFVSKGRS